MRRAGRAPEVKVVGMSSCRALFARRPEAIRRVYVMQECIGELADVLRWCADRRIAYHVVGREDLRKLTETVHHDGVCMLARVKPAAGLGELLVAVKGRGPCSLVLLDGVRNPHNFGAIVRVCAYFGVPYVLAAEGSVGLSEAALRTAEGGGELVGVVDVGDGVAALTELRAQGFALVATSSHATSSLEREPLPKRCVLLFGSESAGLSRALERLASRTVAIPGAGELESLNVACASSVLLWEHWRAWRTGAAAPAPSPDAPVRPRRG